MPAVDPGQPKVGNLEDALVRDEQIGGLDVAVHYANFVQIFEAAQEHPHVTTSLLARHWIQLVPQSAVECVRHVLEHQPGQRDREREYKDWQ